MTPSALAAPPTPAGIQSIVEHLNAELASALVLSLNATRYHWMVTGQHFRDYHLRFDELYEAVHGTFDELAERIRMLGGIPIHSPAQIEKSSLIPSSDPDRDLSAQDMLSEALSSLERIIGAMHEGIELATNGGDPGTADLLTRFVQVHQKEAWFLRSMLVE